MKPAGFLLLLWLGVAPSARGYVLNLNTNGFARHWNLLTPQSGVSTNLVNTNTHAIRFFFASDAYSTTNTTAELNALRAAFAQWQAISNTYLKFEEGGLVAPPVDVNSADNMNVVFWAKTNNGLGQVLVNGGNDDISGSTAVTFTSTTTSNNTLLASDIVFNGVEKQWITDFLSTTTTFGITFVESTALHEIGHVLGLAHSPVGGATMYFRGSPGVNLQAGLSADDIAAAQFLYPITRTNLGAIRGTITKNGSPVFGAQVLVQNSLSNVVAGTVTPTNGTYEVNMLVPGAYEVRVTPLDPPGSERLVSGPDISFDFIGADTSFLPTTNVPVAVTANITNTVNITVTNVTPAFRITRLRLPSPDSSSLQVVAGPRSLTVGQSNYFIGIASPSIPSNNATLTITGNGLTVGAAQFVTNASGLNYIIVPISVSSNATPGLRSFIVQKGTNVAYANGFLDIQSAVYDHNFDGLNDLFQRQYFDPFTSASAAPGADPDGDGMNNSAEYIAGTIPTNASSVLKMSSVNRTGTTATVRWQSVSGIHYQVAYRTNVASGSWSNLGSVVTAAGATSLLNDTSATNVFRTYRVQVVP